MLFVLSLSELIARAQQYIVEILDANLEQVYILQCGNNSVHVEFNGALTTAQNSTAFQYEAVGNQKLMNQLLQDMNVTPCAVIAGDEKVMLEPLSLDSIIMRVATFDKSIVQIRSTKALDVAVPLQCQVYQNDHLLRFKLSFDCQEGETMLKKGSKFFNYECNVAQYKDLTANPSVKIGPCDIDGFYNVLVEQSKLKLLKAVLKFCRFLGVFAVSQLCLMQLTTYLRLDFSGYTLRKTDYWLQYFVKHISQNFVKSRSIQTLVLLLVITFCLQPLWNLFGAITYFAILIYFQRRDGPVNNGTPESDVKEQRVESPLESIEEREDGRFEENYDEF